MWEEVLDDCAYEVFKAVTYAGSPPPWGVIRVDRTAAMDWLSENGKLRKASNILGRVLNLATHVGLTDYVKKAAGLIRQ